MEKKAALWAAFLFLPGTSSGALCASGSISLCALPARHRPLDRVNTGRLRDGGHLITFFVFEFTVSEERPDRLQPGTGGTPEGLSCIKLLFDFGVIDPAQRRLNKAGSPPAFPITIVAVVGTIGTQLNGTYSSVSTQLKGGAASIDMVFVRPRQSGGLVRSSLEFQRPLRPDQTLLLLVPIPRATAGTVTPVKRRGAGTPPVVTKSS